MALFFQVVERMNESIPRKGIIIPLQVRYAPDHTGTTHPYNTSSIQLIKVINQRGKEA